MKNKRQRITLKLNKQSIAKINTLQIKGGTGSGITCDTCFPCDTTIDRSIDNKDCGSAPTTKTTTTNEEFTSS